MIQTCVVTPVVTVFVFWWLSAISQETEVESNLRQIDKTWEELKKIHDDLRGFKTIRDYTRQFVKTQDNSRQM